MFNTQVNNVLGKGYVHVEIDAEGGVGAGLDGQNARLNLLQGHHSPGKKAKTTGFTGGGHQGRICHPAHGRLDNGIAAA